MTQHNYTHVIDMSDSEAFFAGFYDDVEKVLYLTFKNGTTSTRQAPAETTPEDVEEIDSWGRQWWSTLRDLPSGPDVEPGDEFVYRAAPAAVQAAAAESDADLSDDAWTTFKDSLAGSLSQWGEEWILDDYADELQAALSLALAVQSEPTEVNEDDNEPESLADATRNSEGTFLGIGFVDVPSDLERKLHSALGFFNEFVRDEIGDIKSHVERYDVSTMRDFFRGVR